MDRETLKKIFDFINERLFDDLLNVPALYLMSDEEAQELYPEYPELFHDGLFFPDLVMIAINEDCENIFDTLLHEMIHLWQFQNHKYMGHGGWFLIWSRKAIEEFYT